MMDKILVADDDLNICELLRLYLEKEGFEVVMAHDGEEAVAKFESEKPSLILLDIMMPKLDGWQVCRQIRQKSDCPIIMLTAKGETFDKVLGLERAPMTMLSSPSIPRRSWPASRPCCGAAAPPAPPKVRSRRSATIS